MTKTGTRYQRSPHIVGYWRPEGLELLNLSTDVTHVASPAAADVLASCTDWTSTDEIALRLPHRSRAAIESEVLALMDATMLKRWGDSVPEREKLLTDWGDWSPAAAYLHLVTRNLAFTDPAKERRPAFVMRARPAAVKSYSDGMTFELPHFSRNGELPEVLLERRTWRRFGEDAIPLDVLASLCGLTFGVQSWLVFDGTAPQALKTSPSGGARHSIEAYICARNVAGLPAGIYHYGPDTHVLSRVRDGFTVDDIGGFLPAQPWYTGAAVVVFMTSVFARVQWRYKHARAYRNVFLEAGHLGQTFCLLATRLGLAPFCTAAIAEDPVELALGVDGVSEAAREPAVRSTRRSCDAHRFRNCPSFGNRRSRVCTADAARRTNRRSGLLEPRATKRGTRDRTLRCVQFGRGWVRTVDRQTAVYRADPARHGGSSSPRCSSSSPQITPGRRLGPRRTDRTLPAKAA